MKNSHLRDLNALFFKACVSTLALLLTGGSAYASLIAVHSGANDPTTEGWSATAFQNTTAGALSPDSVGGLDAWFVDDNGSSSGDSGFYSVTPSSGQITEAQTFGWSLFTRLRLPDSSDAGDGSPSVAFHDGTTSYDMTFSTDAGGNPTILLWDGGSSGGSRTGASYSLAGGSIYHTFELRFDPVAGSADLFVDGVEQLSNYSGFSVGSTGIFFGAISSGGTGQGNFNSVTFTTAVPLPPAAWLFASGLFGLIGTSIRKKTG